MAGRYELKLAKTGQFHFSLLAGNGQVILQSAMYDSKASALNAIASIQKNASNDHNYERLVSKTGKPYFVLKAANSIVLGQSQLYESEAGRDNGIESVKKNAVVSDIQSFFEQDFQEASNKNETINIGSIRTFLTELEKINNDDEHVIFYRGHSDVTYELIPSIYRNVGWIKNEDVMFKELVLRCPAEFEFSESTFQTLVKMQHYSLPTRLLDITSNPLVALYYATSEINSKNKDGEVIVFKIPKSEIKYFDSDTVSVISNLSLRPSTFAIRNTELSKEGFNSQDEIKYLLHEIRKEKPYFQPLIKPEHIGSVLCVKPKLDNARILKQDGLFLLFGIDGTKTTSAKVPLNYLANLENFLIISRDKKDLIRNQLKALGVTRGSIFPDIENVANFIKNEFQI